MTRFAVVVVTGSLVASAFVAGVAIGKGAAPTPRFVATDELKWDAVSGLKVGTLYGDSGKGPWGGLIKVPAGHTSTLRSHTGAYEAVQISGTSSHWLRGEDGSKAKKMTPGSYWTFPAKTEHVSSCAPGVACVIFTWQKTKYDVVLAKDTMLPAGGVGAVVSVPVPGVTAGAAAVKK